VRHHRKPLARSSALFHCLTPFLLHAVSSSPCAAQGTSPFRSVFTANHPNIHHSPHHSPPVHRHPPISSPSSMPPEQGSRT
jgi:hypothetical protein